MLPRPLPPPSDTARTNRTGQSVTKGSAPAFSASYNPATNRMVGQSYDNNGNLLSLPWNQNGIYDVENRLKEVTAPGYGPEKYGYNPTNQRIWKQRRDATEEFDFYGSQGELLGTYKLEERPGSTKFVEVNTDIYFHGKLIHAKHPPFATNKSQGEPVILDRLGSVRLAGRIPSNFHTYYPYGEEMSHYMYPSRREDFAYATYFRDQDTGIDYARNRYYSSTWGQFLTPDPYQASAGPSDPGSWNRYPYVQGDPVNYLDPSGHGPMEVGEFMGCQVSWLGGPWGWACAGYGENAGARIDYGLVQRGGGGGGDRGGGGNLAGTDIDMVRELGIAADCLGKAALDQLGLSAAAAGIGVLGLPLPKDWLPPYRVIGNPNTNLLSVIGHYIQIAVPRIVIAGRASPNLFRIAGRLAWPVSLALLVVDMTLITHQTWQCYQTQSALNRDTNFP